MASSAFPVPTLKSSSAPTPSVSAPQYANGASITTRSSPSSFSSLSPCFTPFYPQSQNKHSFSQPEFNAGYETYYSCQPTDGSGQNYYQYMPLGVDGSQLSNYTGYKASSAVQGFYDPRDHQNAWQEFGAADNSEWADQYSGEELYADAETMYLPSDSLSYPPESTPFEDNSCTSSTSNTGFFPAPTSNLSHSQGPYVVSSVLQNINFMDQANFSGSWQQNQQNLHSDVACKASVSLEKIHQRRPPSLVGELEKVVSGVGDEHRTADGFGQGEERATSQGRITWEEQSSHAPSSYGFALRASECKSEQVAAASSEENGYSQSQEQKLFTGERLPWKGGAASPGMDSPAHVSSISSCDIEFNEDAAVGVQEVVPPYLGSLSVGITEGVIDSRHGLLVKSICASFADGDSLGSKNTISIGHESRSGPTHMGASTYEGSPIDLEQQGYWASLVDKPKVPLVVETKGFSKEETLLNDIQDAHHEDSKCGPEVQNTDKQRLRVEPLSNGCQLLVSTIHNLSRVLFMNQSVEYSDCSPCVDLDALENSISMLSECLLKRSTKLSDGISHDPVMKREQKIQGQSKRWGQYSNEADIHVKPENNEVLQRSLITSLQPLVNIQGEMTAETGLSACRRREDLLDARLERTASKNEHVEDMESFVIKDVGKPLKEGLELQVDLLKLQEDIAHERRESNAVVSVYKNLWREAQEALQHFRSEMLKTKGELEGLKQVLRKPRHPGGSDGSSSKAQELGSLDLNEGLCLSSLDLTLLSKHDSEVHPITETQGHLDGIGNWDLYYCSGKGLPKVLTGYFDPVESAVDSESVHSFPDAKEVISRFSLIQERGACNDVADKHETVCSSVSKSSLYFPTNTEKSVTHRLSVIQERQSCNNMADKDGTACSYVTRTRLDSPSNIERSVSQRLSVLLAREAIDLNLSSADGATTSSSLSDLGISSGPATYLVSVGEAMESDRTLDKSDSLPPERKFSECVEQCLEEVGSACCVDSNSASKVVEEIKSGTSHGLQAEQVGILVDALQAESTGRGWPSVNAQERLKGEATLLQDGETRGIWNTCQSDEREIICLRTSDAESRITFLEGDSEWEHVLVSVI